MLFPIKPVIKSICVLTMMISFLSCQDQKNDDQILLNKVITSELKDPTPIEMSLRGDFTSKVISNYYRARFLNEHPIKVHSTHEDPNDSIQEISDQRELTNSIIQLFDHPKVLFSKADIESMMEQQKNTDDWKSTDFKALNVILKQNDINSKSDLVLYRYRVSKPLYSLDKSYAIIHYDLPEKSSHLVVCEREGKEWVFIKTLKKVL